MTSKAFANATDANRQQGGRRNLIINGAMQVAQRGTSATAINSNGYNTVDRFRMALGVGSLGSYDVSQSTDAPNGFSNSLKLEVETAEASPASNAYSYIAYKFEGQDLQGLSKGNSNAKPLTLSFWVKSSKTGNVQVNLRDLDNSRLVGQTFSINSANTWEYKTVTYPADTSGALDNDNNASIRVSWWLDSGSTYNTGSTPTTWEALVSADRAAGTDISFADTVGATFYLTGVQLEVGDTATPFEHRSYGEELALCQRYYQSYNFEKNSGFPAVGRKNGNPWGQFAFPLRTTMRAAPSGTWLGTNNGMIVVRVSDGTTETPTSIDVVGVSVNALTIRPETTDFSTGTPLVAISSGTSNQMYFEVDAEL